MKLSLSFWQRLLLLLLLFIAGTMLTGAVQLLTTRLTDNSVAATRIVIVMQDMLAFILPALATAMLITRLPADFLRLRRLPSWRMLLTALATLLVSLPAIEGINDLCKQLPWPQEVLRLEASLDAATRTMLGADNAANLVVSLLIMAIFTGLAEELFFRGALQRLLESRPMTLHLAVWLAAGIFSLMHGQPIGFVPRMLLGALFGYAAVWSGSLWTAVACHAVNNALAVITLRTGADIVSTPVMSIISAALTAAGVYWLARQSRSSGI